MVAHLGTLSHEISIIISTPIIFWDDLSGLLLNYLKGLISKRTNNKTYCISHHKWANEWGGAEGEDTIFLQDDHGQTYRDMLLHKLCCLFPSKTTVL